MGLFSGTAKDYDEYRQNAPDALVDYIITSTPEPHDNLLDLGTGTGAVLEQFLPHFSSAVAVEPEADMRTLGEKRLKGKSVTFLSQSAEDLRTPDNWQASLVTICRAFHWMDRPLVLQNLSPIVRGDGVVAIFGSKSIWRLNDEWSRVAKSVVQEFLGPERQTTSGAYTHLNRPFTEDLTHSPFSQYEQKQFPFDHTFTLEAFTHYLHSTSFASKALLGGTIDAFDKRLQEKLQPYATDGILTQHNEFTLLLARRP